MLKKILPTPTQLSVLVLIFLCSLLLSTLPTGSGLIHAQSSNSNLHSLLEELINEKLPFYISFTSPVFGEGAMLSINDAQVEATPTTSQILQARVREVGDDFLCVSFYGVNVVDVSCFPFWNIARINYIAP